MTRFIRIENDTDIPLERAVLSKKNDSFLLSIKTSELNYSTLGTFEIASILDCNTVRKILSQQQKEDLFIFIDELSLDEKMLLTSI